MLSITNLDPLGALIFLLLIGLWFIVLTKTVADLLNYIQRRPVTHTSYRRLSEVLIFLPIVYFGVGGLADPRTIHTASRLIVEIMTPLCLISYFYSSYRKKIGSLGLEIVINGFLLAGFAWIIFGLPLSYGLNGVVTSLTLCLPINILFVHVLLENYNKLRAGHPHFPIGNKIPRDIVDTDTDKDRPDAEPAFEPNGKPPGTKI
jgi:hypothetical protein